MNEQLLNCFLAAVVVVFAGSDAPTRFAELRKKVEEARESKDQKRLLAAEIEVAEFFHDSAPATEQLALTFSEIGDQVRALQAVHDFVAMGQADDNLPAARPFAAWKDQPEFKELMHQMDLNKTPIYQADPLVEFKDPGLIPEDIDYDPSTEPFLVTSVLGKKIVRISLDGRESDFAKSPEGWPMLAIKIDRIRGLLWATEVALDKFAAAPSKDWGRSMILCLDLKNRTIVREVEGPAESALGDMALTPDGDVLVADNNGGGLYRLRSKAGSKLERIDGGDFLSPQPPVVLPRGSLVFVPDYERGVALLDTATKQARWIDGRKLHTLHGVDGLYLQNGSLLAIQNGSAPERVVRFRLDPEFREVTAEEVIERSTPTLGDPTHGVIVGDRFYYIANSGWDSLDGTGKLKQNATMTRARIMRSKFH